jgi:hypothetical protein
LVLCGIATSKLRSIKIDGMDRVVNLQWRSGLRERISVVYYASRDGHVRCELATGEALDA